MVCIVCQQCSSNYVVWVVGVGVVGDGCDDDCVVGYQVLFLFDFV